MYCFNTKWPPSHDHNGFMATDTLGHTRLLSIQQLKWHINLKNDIQGFFNMFRFLVSIWFSFLSWYLTGQQERKTALKNPCLRAFNVSRYTYIGFRFKCISHS